MYNPKDIVFVGKHDYDKESAERMASNEWANTFSVGIFQWQLKNDGKSMKRGKVIVRVTGKCNNKYSVFKMSELVVNQLDNKKWDGRKTVSVW